MESSSLLERDRKYVWHPFTQHKIATSPLSIQSAKGVFLYDFEGRSYIDAISSWWVNLHGHCHPYIIDKMVQQMQILDHVIFAQATHEGAVTLAERLIPLLPGKMEKLFFSDNGSCSVEVALKMAFQFWHNQNPNTKRAKIIALKGSYHGDTFGAMSCAGPNGFNKPFWKHLFEIDSIDPPLHGQEEKSLHQLKSLLSKGDTAAFIFEPSVLAAGGMLLTSTAGTNSLLAECRRNGVLIIVDEVMTGFGRTGPLFASERFIEKPDIIALSKGITGGVLPLGATAATQAIFDQFFDKDHTKAFLHGHSYTANPLACQAALASLDLLLEADCTQNRLRIQLSHEVFLIRIKGTRTLQRAEVLGTLLILELREEENSYFSDRCKNAHPFFLKRGIFLRPLGNVLYLLPPYTIQENELNHIYNSIEEYLASD